MQFYLTLSSPVYFLLLLAVFSSYLLSATLSCSTPCFYFLFSSYFLQLLVLLYLVLLLSASVLSTLLLLSASFMFSSSIWFLSPDCSSPICFSTSFWFNAVPFPPPAALVGGFFCWLAGWLNFLGLQEVPTNQYFVMMLAGQSVFITFTNYESVKTVLT